MMRFIIAQRYRLFFGILAILFLTVYSFGQILSLSFGWDDYTNLYYLVHNKSFQYPYYADQLRVLPLFRLFSLSPQPYYIVSLTLFFLDTLLVTILTYRITLHYKTAWIAGAMFILLSVGSDGMYYAMEGIRNTQFLFLLLCTLLILYEYGRHRRTTLYIPLYILFVITTTIFPYRAFFLLPLLVIYGLPVFNLRILPFVLADVTVFGLLPKWLSPQSSMGHIHPLDFLNSSLPHLLQNFLFTFLYSLIPNTLPARFPEWQPIAGTYFPPIGLILLFCIVFFLIRNRSRKPYRFLLMNILSIAVISFSFSLITNEYMDTNYRYLLAVRPFVAMFLSGLLICRTRKWIIFLIIFLVTIHALKHVEYQNQVIIMRGSFAKKAIATILTHVPSIRGNTLFFLDASTNELRHRFGEAVQVGTFPSGASLATYYKTTYDRIEITDYVHCDVFESILKSWKNQPINLYYFIATEDGISPGPKENSYQRCNLNPAYFNGASVQ
ncbi:hypothetical protein HY948_02660 [Candidatus Gottesmanbacteria bacterium]|nr:hypothetical protein [Candidatus Gottesmanbacteria bacterium]